MSTNVNLYELIKVSFELYVNFGGEKAIPG